jgi:hypothetical protein
MMCPMFERRKWWSGEVYETCVEIGICLGARSLPRSYGRYEILCGLPHKISVAMNVMWR